MWELTMFAKKKKKKKSYFRHSAVWVSLLQLVFLRFPHPLNFQTRLKKNHRATHRMFWNAGQEQAWLLQTGRGKHKLTVELVPRRCGRGAVGPGGLMVPILPLFLFSSSLPLIPGLASAQGKPVAACHLMEVPTSFRGLGWAQVPASPQSWTWGPQGFWTGLMLGA